MYLKIVPYFEPIHLWNSSEFESQRSVGFSQIKKPEMLFTSIFITSAIFAAPIPLPQGPGFGGAWGAGGIIGARAVANTVNGAQSSYAAQQAA